ncbi:MAG: hypothetical protein H0Z33_14305 [Bacillaceae bacterium]|nr:hypothetical protein [Bacillaceae bacterium]
MNKKRWISLGIFSLIIVIILAIFMTKPDESDFVQWFQEKYDLSCYDANCDRIVLKDKNGDTREDLTFWHFEGYYDHSAGFLGTKMQLKRLYRNVDHPNQSYFSIEVEGFLGDIKEIEFSEYHVDVLKNKH